MKLTNPLLLATGCSAARLFVASLSGNITTVSFNNTKDDYSLTKLSSTDGCNANPSWLELDAQSNTLYCANEAWANGTHGTVSSYSIGPAGCLTQNSNIATFNGAVSLALYNNRTALAVAHYSQLTSGVSALSLENKYAIEIIQNSSLTTSNGGGANIHQALLDPFGKHIFTPALATDQVHWWKVDPVTSALNHTGHIDSDQVPPGSGPRHGVFYKAKNGNLGAELSIRDGQNKTNTQSVFARYFLVTEKTNKVFGFVINYGPNQESIEGATRFLEVDLFKDGAPNVNTTGAEIAISPDNRFLIVSTRNDTLHNVTHSKKKDSVATNQTDPVRVSDTLHIFEILEDGAKLVKISETPAGGFLPRSFAINPDGTFIAVVLSGDGHLAILARDPETGRVSNETLATLKLSEGLSSVVWDLNAPEAIYDDDDGEEETPASSTISLPDFTTVTSFAPPSSTPTTLLTSSTPASSEATSSAPSSTVVSTSAISLIGLSTNVATPTSINAPATSAAYPGGYY